jgi:hypothetical protein
MNKLLKPGALFRRVEVSMQKLNFLFLLVGGLMILGCQLPGSGGGGEDQGGTVQEDLMVTASPSNGGTITRSPDQTRYTSDSSVTLTANPESGYVFTRWEGDLTGSANPTTILMNGDKAVAAVFTPTYTLTVAASPSDGGTVSRLPEKTEYAGGSFVALTANPASGYEFTRWEGDATGSANPTTILMNGDKTVAAVFAPATTPLIRPSTSTIAFAVGGKEGGPYSIQGSNVKTIDITNGGIGTLSGLDCSLVGTPIWLFATLSGSNAPATLTITVRESAVPGWLGPSDRLESARIAITSAVASNSPQYVTVVLSFYVPPPTGPTYIFTGGAPTGLAGGTVICTELHRQGLMDEAIFKADEAFGRYLRDNQKEVLIGYHFWARPIVRLMQKSHGFAQIVNVLAKPWSYEMAYRVGARDKGSFVGKILMDVGVPVCRIIGRVVDKGQEYRFPSRR